MAYLLFLFWLWWPGVLAPPSPLEPLQIAEQFVAPSGWAPMKEYLCCEAARQARRQTLGQQIPARLRRRCQLVLQNETSAVVAVELRDSLPQSDFYLHFSREAEGWKLQAVRSLAMTRVGPPMVGILLAMPPAEVARYNQKHPEATHAFAVGNLRLWTSSDADISNHFHHHQADFEEVVRLVQAGNYFALAADSSRTAEQRANANPAIRARLQELYISRVRRAGPDGCACLEFLIGGVNSHTVGLLFAPDPASVPAMSPDGLIILRPLGQGWYLFKTT